jgi:PKD repeat protein
MLADYDSHREQIYLAYSISGVVFPNSFFTSSGLSVFRFDGFEKLDLVKDYGIANVDLVMNDSRTEFLTDYRYEQSNTETSVISTINLDEVQHRVIIEHNSNNAPYFTYNKLRFTSIDNQIAAINNLGELVIISKADGSFLSKHNIKKYVVNDYCFNEKNNYLIMSGHSLNFYDFATRRVIDSVPNISQSGKSQVKYSHLHKKLLFASETKFGIFDSKFHLTVSNVAFIADSNFVYTGQSVKLYNKSNIDYDTIEWELSDGRRTFHPNPTFTFDSPGMIDVRLRLTKDGKVFEKGEFDFIEVYPLLKPDFDSDVRIGNAPLTVNFVDKSVGVIINRTWLVNGQPFSETKLSTYTFDKVGRYHISLIVQDKHKRDTLTKYYHISVGKSQVQPLVLKGSVYTYSGSYYDEVYEDYRDRWIRAIGTQIVKDSIYSYFASHGADQTFANHSLKLDNNMNLIMNSNTFIYKNLQHHQYSNLISFNDTLLIYNIMPQGLRKINPISNKETFASNEIISQLDLQLSLVKIDNNSVLVGGLYYWGQDNYVNSRIVISDINGTIVKHDSIIEKFIEFVKFSDELIFVLAKSDENKYVLLKYSSQLELIDRYELDLPTDINLKSILKIPNGLIAFCGEQITDSVGVVGTLNSKGEVVWMKEMPDWKVLHRLYNNRNTFFAIGTVRSNGTGFIEIDGSGTHFTDNRFPATNPHTVFDLDILSKNELILTFYGSTIWVVNKVQYKPLDQPAEIIDTISTVGVYSEPNLSHSILPVPNPAENSVTLQFEDSQIVQKVQVYDYSGIEVMQFTLPQSPVYEVQLPLHALSTGMYHVTVTTDSGILRTKFIKY